MNGTRIAMLLAIAINAHCADLSVDLVSAPVGLAVPIMVRFATGGTSVSALQFDLSYDSSIGIWAVADAASITAGKDLYSVDIDRSRRRFLLAGLNQNSLDTGTIVALTALPGGNAIAGTYALRLSNLVASDRQGHIVPITSTDGSVTVSGSPDRTPLGMFPHLAAGGGWKTRITLLNLSSDPSEAKLTFWDDEGAPLALPLTFTPAMNLAIPANSSASIVIPPNGLTVVETDLPVTSAPLVGWTRLKGSSAVVGMANFRYHATAGLNLEALVPLETRTPISFVLPFDNTPGVETGVAVANGSDSLEARIAIMARDILGSELKIDSITLPIRGHTSFMLSNRYPSLQGLVGSLEFHNDAGASISVVGLRVDTPVDSAGSLTAVLAQAK